MRGSVMELSFRTMMYVGCGCFVGGVLRYITAVVISSGWGITEVDMPWHTLFINFGGCLFMGIFCAMGVHGLIESPNLRAALMTGLCGGYSTLASFAPKHRAHAAHVSSLLQLQQHESYPQKILSACTTSKSCWQSPVSTTRWLTGMASPPSTEPHGAAFPGSRTSNIFKLIYATTHESSQSRNRGQISAPLVSTSQRRIPAGMRCILLPRYTHA